jgi:chemotaxis methyl-accepting protein methylase
LKEKSIIQWWRLFRSTRKCSTVFHKEVSIYLTSSRQKSLVCSFLDAYSQDEDGSIFVSGKYARLKEKSVIQWWWLFLSTRKCSTVFHKEVSIYLTSRRQKSLVC